MSKNSDSPSDVERVFRWLNEGRNVVVSTPDDGKWTFVIDGITGLVAKKHNSVRGEYHYNDDAEKLLTEWLPDADADFQVVTDTDPGGLE